MTASRGGGLGASGRGSNMVLKGRSVKFTTVDLFLKTSGEALQMVVTVCVCLFMCACDLFALLHKYNLTRTFLRYELSELYKVNMLQIC